ncbi:TatD family hydrolase [Neptunicella sp. SCSIO 80796]|uniref:TatD family hydrolase n=1 Tax=Neptunicella plasticusilytica TaxID=3117012 RepID=UPI003A4E2303
MIDSHCHLDFATFDQDRDAILQRCAEAGLTDIVIPGTQQQLWTKQIALCQRQQQNSPALKFALGLHPYFLDSFQTEHLGQLKLLLEQHLSTAVAVGEMGIDQAIDIPLELQISVFEQQLEIASQLSLPVIVHHRRSHHLIQQSVKRCQFKQGGVIHAFSGSLQQAEAYIESGFKLGIGGVITYPRAAKTRKTVSKLPLDSILLETDAPDMPISGRQGQRNSPEFLPEILDSLVELRSESRAEIERITDQNCQQLFAFNKSRTQVN